MSTHDEKVRLKITLTEEEKTKLERLVVYCPEMTEECLRFERLFRHLYQLPEANGLAANMILTKQRYGKEDKYITCHGLSILNSGRIFIHEFGVSI